MAAPIPFRKAARYRGTIGRYWPQHRSRRRQHRDGPAIGLALALAALIGWNAYDWMDRVPPSAPGHTPTELAVPDPWAVSRRQKQLLQAQEGAPVRDDAQRGSIPSTDTVSVTIPVCGSGARYTCVVDGDTFWLNGEKIRIADIDTPEISSPRCPAELDRGNLAKQRLASLLNAGPFALEAADRAQDRYGRSLYTVTRSGESIGSALVGEGLAVWYGNGRPDWC